MEKTTPGRLRGEEDSAARRSAVRRSAVRRSAVQAPMQAPLTIGGRSFAFVMVALFTAMLLAALDQAIFGTALPTIVGDLHGVHLMLWVATGYILASTLVMPVYGKLGDLIGHKMLLISALVLFLVGSVLGGLSENMTMLIAARGIQGLGGGGLMILSQAVVADIVPPRRRGFYLGVLVGSWALASIVGPILGGWFADTVGWRWTFWFSLPLGAVALMLVAAFLRTPTRKRSRPRLDGRGMAGIAVCTTAAVLVTSWGGTTYSWTSGIILGLIGLTVVSGVLFVLVERKAAEPVLPLHLFRDRNFNLATMAGLFGSVAFFGAVTYVPTYLQMATGISPTASGMLLIPMSIGLLAASLFSGALAGRTGRYKWMPIVGSLIVAVSLMLLWTMTPTTGSALVTLYLLILGVGSGLCMQILLLMVQNSFPITEVGTATGAHSFFRQIGASIGSAAVGTLFTSRLMALLGERMAALGEEAAGAVDRASLTPAAVAQMTEEMRGVVVSSYNDALAPVFLYIVPLMILAALILLWVKEKPLALTNELPAESQEEISATGYCRS